MPTQFYKFTHMVLIAGESKEDAKDAFAQAIEEGNFPELLDPEEWDVEPTGEYLDSGYVIGWLKANNVVAKNSPVIWEELKPFLEKLLKD